jgi:hypothetical protein
MDEVVNWRNFFFRCHFFFLCKHTADPEHSSPTYYTSIDAVSAKHVPLGVSSIHLIPWGSYTQKPLIFGTAMEISSLNVYGHISA